MAEGAGILTPLLRAYASRGISADDALNRITNEFGLLGFSSFTGLYGRAIAEVATESYLTSLGYDELPEDRLLAASLTQLTRNYSFTVELFGQDPVTGEFLTRYSQISTDEILSRGEIERLAAMSAADTEDASHPMLLRHTRLVRGMRQAG